MPGAGFEPTWGFPQGILSPLRLPISPPRLAEGKWTYNPRPTTAAVGSPGDMVFFLTMTHDLNDFVHSDAAEPHRARTKEILRKHPEIRDLIGPNPATLWYALFIVSVQLVLAVLVANQPWWVVFAVAYCL